MVNIMDDNKKRWLYSRDNLMTAVRSLGYPDKLGEEANARYNEMLYYGLGNDDDDTGV